MSENLDVLDLTGSIKESITVEKDWLEREKGEQAVHETIVATQAAMRAGTACTKNRAKVRGGGTKPYKQKGTGRARAGSRVSPIWRGGGIVFGPIPRNYNKSVNKKIKRLALKRVFTERFDEGDIIIVDELKLDSIKTKSFNDFLNQINAGDNALIITAERDLEKMKNLHLSIRNLKNIDTISAENTSAYQLLLFKKIVFTKEAFDAFGEKLVRK